MTVRIREARNGRRGGAMLAAGALLAAASLAGCSSIPDSLNPVNWAQGVGDWVSDTTDWVMGNTPDETQPAAQPDQSAQSDQTPKLGNDQRPVPPSQTQKQAQMDELAADRANADYDEAEAKREGADTRSLDDQLQGQPEPASQVASATPAPAASNESDQLPGQATSPPPAPKPNAATAPKPIAAAPAPAPVPATAPMPAPAPAGQGANPQDESAVSDEDLTADLLNEPVVEPGSDADVEAAPPPPPPGAAPAPVARPMTAAPAPMPAAAPAPAAMASAPSGAPIGSSVEDTYHKRLAEFSQPAPLQVASAAPAPVPSDAGMASASGSGIKLIPPGQTRLVAAHGSGGAHPLSALDPNKAAASFMVADLAFGEGTFALDQGGESQLRDVAQLYRQSGGSARIEVVGHSNSSRLDVSAAANMEDNRSLAAQRADAVAVALEHLGVPASHIYAGGLEDGTGDHTEVFAEF